MSDFGEYMVLLNGQPLQKPYGSIFTGLHFAKKHCDALGITGRAEIVEVLEMDVQLGEDVDEDLMTRGYILEHVSADRTRHLLGFHADYDALMSARAKNASGLNLQERKLILVSPETLATLVAEIQTTNMDSPSP